MKGFADMVSACWRIQNKHRLTDKEMFKLLSNMSIKYNDKLQNIMRCNSKERNLLKRRENDFINVDN